MAARKAPAQAAIKLRPVASSHSLKEHVYPTLRAAIMEMDIYGAHTNLRLDERQLAEQLQVSRTPIREALAQLEREGFVEIRPRKGVYVRSKTLPEVLEIVTVWAALESMAARLVTQVASDRELASLRKLGVKHSALTPAVQILPNIPKLTSNSTSVFWNYRAVIFCVLPRKVCCSICMRSGVVQCRRKIA